MKNHIVTFPKFLKALLLYSSFFLLTSCTNFLTKSENFLCIDSKGTVNNYVLEVQRSFFANSALMKIPSRVLALGAKRTICSEDDETIFAADNCRGTDSERQRLIFGKKSGKLEIYVTPTIIRKASCSPIIN